MEFYVMYTTVQKKATKYFKINRIRNKYIIDIKDIIATEELDPTDKTYLKIFIFNKIQQAMEKNKDIYYIPDFDQDFSIDKLLNLKKLLEGNNFNILVFVDDFKKKPHILTEAFTHLDKFSNSQILKDY